MRSVPVAAAAALALLLGPTAMRAGASPIDVESCHAGDGTVLPASALKLRTHRVARGGGNRCITGGGALAVQIAPGSRPRRGAYVEARFSAPGPTATLTRADLTRAVVIPSGYEYRLIAFVGSSRRAERVEGCTGAACAGLGGSHSGALPSGTRALSVRVSCASRRCARAPKTGPAVAISRSVVTVDDGDPPALTRQPGGQLVDQTLQTGQRTLSVSAKDVGTGLRTIALSADGQIVARWPASSQPCEPPYTTAQPCRTSISSVVSFDTTALDNGAHELKVGVLDATGQNVGSSEGFLVTTSNPGKAGDVALLSATLGEGSGFKPVLTAGYDRSITLTGRLTNAQGVPAPGAALQVLTRIAGPGGAQVGQPTPISTDASGAYSVAIPSGPSRTFTVSYVDASGRTIGAGRALLEVPAPLTFRATRASGRRYELAGTVTGQPRPAQGVSVEIQARRGSSWQTFRTLQTDGVGQYATSYRFLGRGSFKLRAIVREQNGYPYATGASPSVTARVR